MAKLNTKMVTCVRCLTENYLLRERGLSYYLFLLGSILVGLIVFLGIAMAVPLASYNEVNGTFRISYVMLVIGGALGTAVMTIIMKIINWNYGTFSIDKNDKALSDYD